MPYLKRTLTQIIKIVNQEFPVLLLTGPRQVGKTTLLQACAKTNRKHVTLDDLEQRALAQNDPELFLQTWPAPLLIDEAQYAPALFSAIKMRVDENRKPGQYWLTGSQKFHLMRDISESLAGRVAVLDLLGLSQAEIQHRAGLSLPFLPTLQWIAHASSKIAVQKTNTSLQKIYYQLWQGSFPKAVLGKKNLRDIFFRSYIQTYIERDVRALTQVGNEIAFSRFLRVAAARTAQLINYADMARDVGIDQKTIKTWLSILETSGLVYLLYPWHNNITKRMIKTPKLYFLDTGLCAWLTQWSTSATLEAGAMSGAILETGLFIEILKSWWHNGRTAQFYFYRDRDQKEIDLLIEQDGLLYPIEFKKTATPQLKLTHFSVLDHLKQKIGPGAIICLKKTHVPLSKTVTAIPITYL